MKSLSFKFCFAIFVVGAVILRWADNPSPGIITFELARTIENANTMVNTWQQLDALYLKKFSLYFDFVFIVGYAGSLYIVIQEWWQKSNKKWLYYLSFLPIIAGILDGIENLGLLKIVHLSGTQFHASLAFYCASIKFAILLPSIFAVFYYLAIKFLRKI